MKRNFIILLSIFMLLSFFGCQGINDNSEYEESLRKAQKIEIMEADSNKIISSITKEQDITSLIDEMKVEEWEIKRKLPDSLSKKYVYRYYAAPTVTYGEDGKKQGDLEAILDLITYEDEPYITIKVGGIELSFDVGKETNDMLNEK